MASVASGASPLSGYEFPDSVGDGDENHWAFVSIPNSAGPNSSVGFFPSPASAALGSSWGFIGHGTQSPEQPPSLPAASPLNLDADQPHLFPDQTADPFSAVAGQPTPDNQFLLDSLFPAEQDYFTPPANSLLTTQFGDLSTLIADPFPSLTSAEQAALSSIDFDIPASILSGVDVPPWNPALAMTTTTAGSSPIFVLEDPSLIPPSPPAQYFSPSPVSPCSPPVHIKHEDSRSPTTKSHPIAIRKVRGDSARITKPKPASSASSAFHKKSSPSSSPLSSSGGSSTFLIVTLDSVNAHTLLKSNPFDCHDLTRSSQRGRKGPLANETKQSALKVRRLGACFHCHARKVKCGEERPCRNCTKLQLQVPHAMCWQFDDFDVVLFPEFIRGHFAKDEMARFVADNIESFTIGGQDRACAVELSSGLGFRATLSIKAKFFTAKTAEVLQQWHLHHVRGVANLQARDAAPIGLDTMAESHHHHREELRKKTDRYVSALVAEPAFAELVTNARHTRLPRTILRIVQDYAARSGNAMVQRALSIYAMHYIMTVQLCLTPQTVAQLADTNLVPQGVPFVTPRVLNRQVKAVVDDVMRAEMTKLFKAFGSALKPKERRGWAPCLAAFLVLCLFMESVETAADTFVISENQIAVREDKPPRWKRAFALGKNQEIENMPFKQVAFQFHQLYQTHSRDAGARSFNPLLDDACLEPGELDQDAAAMVMQLRRLLQEPNWSELDFLSMDPILPKQETYPIHDVAFNYTGRLVAKFLLSFDDERYIIERND